VSGSNDKTVRVWDAERGVQIGSPLGGHTDYVTSVAFSPDGIRIVSGSIDMTVRVWDAERGMQIGSLLQSHTNYVRSVAFSPDGTRIVSNSDDVIVRVWNARRGVKISNEEVDINASQSNEESMYSLTNGKPISHFSSIIILNHICNRTLLFFCCNDTWC